jgi:hypothetical protein
VELTTGSIDDDKPTVWARALRLSVFFFQKKTLRGIALARYETVAYGNRARRLNVASDIQYKFKN